MFGKEKTTIWRKEEPALTLIKKMLRKKKAHW